MQLGLFLKLRKIHYARRAKSGNKDSLARSLMAMSNQD